MLIHAYFLEEDKAEQKVMRPYPPLGLLYVSGYLKKNGVDHEVFDGTFRSFQDLKHQLENQKPDTIGLYANFLTRKNILKIMDHIRSSEALRDIKIITGGPDVRHHKENYLQYGADYLVVGEGEVTFYELVNKLTKGDDPDKIQGIAFKKNGGDVIFTDERLHLKNLDELPLPSRDKIDLQLYLDAWKSHHGSNSMTINTQRGCPFSCRWCSHAVFGDTYRRRSPDAVVDEIEHLTKEYHPDSFWFVDDVFTMSEKWLEEFASLIKIRNLQISYECITRSDKLNEEVIKTLKDSGCTLVWIGAESGSQKVIDLMDRRVDVHQVREMIQLAKEHGIQTGTFIMLGYPGETPEDIDASIAHLKESDPDYFTINEAYPIKGTKMYTDVESYIAKDYNWSDVPDREIKFRRIYSDLFYKFAVRKVFNEVYAQKSKTKGKTINFIKHKLKSQIAGMAMKMFQQKNRKHY